MAVKLESVFEVLDWTPSDLQTLLFLIGVDGVDVDSLMERDGSIDMIDLTLAAIDVINKTSDEERKRDIARDLCGAIREIEKATTAAAIKKRELRRAKIRLNDGTT